MRILSKSGEIIDLDDVRKDAEMMAGYGKGNPYSVDMAIMVKHANALLDALEAALNVRRRETVSYEYGCGAMDALQDVREAAGAVEEGSP